MTTPTERAIAALPPHLRRFVVEQDHAAYTPRDHAVWRHILRRLTAHLRERAHPRYLAGLDGDRHRGGADPEPRRDEREARARGLVGGGGARVHPAGGVHRAAEPARPRDRRRHPHPRAHRVHACAGHRPRERRPRPLHRRSGVRRVPAALRRGRLPGHRLERGPGGLRGDPGPLGGEGGPERCDRRRSRSPSSGSRPPRRACGTSRSPPARAGCTGGPPSTASSERSTRRGSTGPGSSPRSARPSTASLPP